tara:strand:- start:527 stop:1141 length:615 start_codon:yes stop_codon:yes gene_type:complete
MGVKEIQVNIPTEWRDITIETYQKYFDIVESRKKEEEKELDILSLLCNLEKDIIKKIGVKQKQELLFKLSVFINKRLPKKLKKRIKFNGKNYGFIPNLSKITTGEFVDIEDYCKDTNKNLHKMMAVLYREIENQKGDLYNIKAYNPDEVNEQEFKQLPMDITLGALDFFLSLGKDLLQNLSSYLMAQEKMLSKKAYQENGVGTT